MTGRVLPQKEDVPAGRAAVKTTPNVKRRSGLGRTEQTERWRTAKEEGDRTDLVDEAERYVSLGEGSVLPR